MREFPIFKKSFGKSICKANKKKLFSLEIQLQNGDFYDYN
jgi:hypothetical protein